MTIIYAYIAGSIAVGFVVCYSMLWPLIREARAAGVVNEITEYPVVSSVVMTCIIALVAPLAMIIVFVPGLFEAAYLGMRREVMRNS